MRTTAVVAMLISLVSGFSRAQEPKPRFEVASIRRNNSGAPLVSGVPSIAGTTPTGYRATNTTLPALIFHAYGFDRENIVGGPGWVETAHYDVSATAGREVSRVEAYTMLRTLLEERFKLVVATEQRYRNAYTLRLARADGRPGPDLHRAPDDCHEKGPTDYLAKVQAAAKSQPQPSNGLRMSSGNVCATMENVAGHIGRPLNAAVIDETGLKGRWDFVIAHSGLQSETRPARDGTMREYPSIFAAAEEQLGLKVERRREPAPYDVLVIRAVELPSEN